MIKQALIDADLERHYKHNSIAVMIENALFSVIRLATSPYIFLPYYLSRLTDSAMLIGLIPAVFVLGFALPQLSVARFLQRIQYRKRILVLSSLVQRLCILGLLFLTLIQNQLSSHLTIILFFILYSIYNLGRGSYSPTYVDFLGRAIYRDRGRILGISNFMGGILNIAGSLVLARLLTTVSFLRAAMFVFAFAFTGSMISFIAILSLHDVRADREIESWAEKKGSVPPHRKAPTSAAFQSYLGWRIVMIGLELMLPFYSLYGLEKFNLDASYVAIFSVVLTISDAVTNPLWGRLGDKAGYLVVIRSASFLGCLGALSAALSNNVYMFCLVFLLSGMMLSGQQLGNINIVYEFAPREKIPIYTAVHQTVLSLLSGLAPLLGGAITGRMGYAIGCLVAGSLGLAGVSGMIAKVKSPRLETKSLKTEQDTGMWT